MYRLTRPSSAWFVRVERTPPVYPHIDFDVLLSNPGNTLVCHNNALVWDRTSGAVVWSPEVERIYGLSGGAFGGTLAAFLAAVHPEDAAPVALFIEQAVERAEANPEDRAARNYVLEHRIRKPDGATAWIEAHGTFELDEDQRCVGLSGVVIDVSAHKEVEQRLREQSAEYRLFTELASDYVYSAEFQPDNSLRTRIVAGSFERTTGYSAESLERAGGWIAIVHPDDRPTLSSLTQRLGAGESLVNEYRVIDPAGELRWLRDHVRPVKDHQGRVTRIVGGVTDITGRKRLEAELLQARKLEAIGRLAGAVAHDFNNLLTVILNCADLLARDHPALANNEDILAIGESARRGGDLTRSLLTIGRRQVGLARPVNAVTEVLGAQTVLTRALGDHVTLEVSHVSPAPWVSIDPSQLHLLLLNLAMNARDAMPDGGVLRLSVERLAAGASGCPVELSSDNEYAVISASDTGTGIAPEAMALLFEPFFTTKNDGKGNGLGLATCLGIARTAGGTIVAESHAHSGATFRVYLPVTSRSDASSAAPVLSSRGGRETVLLVEDSASLRALITRDLRGRGYTVIGAGSAEEALELLARRDGLVELALMDIGLPGMAGTALAAKLRIEHPAMKLVLMSGNPGDGETHRLVGDGVPFIQKPFGTNQLGDMLRRVLDGQGA